jgi:hypothetical protein
LTACVPAGAAPGANSVHGHAAGVLKLEVASAAIRLPARSVTPALPLLTVTV